MDGLTVDQMTVSLGGWQPDGRTVGQMAVGWVEL